MKKRILLLAAVSSLANFAASYAAVIPYSNDFSSTGLDNNGGFTLGSGFQTLTATGVATPVGYSTSQFSNAANSSFTITSQFRINSLGGDAGDQSVGLALFGFNSSLTGTSDATRYIFADWRFQGANAGSLRLFEVDGSNTVLGTGGSADTNGTGGGVVTLNTLFTLQATITNTATDTYNISLGLFDAAGTTQIGSGASVTGYSAAGEPSGGYYFGIRSRVPNGSGTTTVAYSDFNVVPEPTSFALLAGGLLVIAALRRRPLLRQ